MQVGKSENSEVLTKLQTTIQKIDNMEKQSKDLENINVENDIFAKNSETNRCQLLELEGKEWFIKCRTQQTLQRLQEYGANFFEATKGVRGAQIGHWSCISSQEWHTKVIKPKACRDGQKSAKVDNF